MIVNDLAVGMTHVFVSQLNNPGFSKGHSTGSYSYEVIKVLN